MRWRSRLVVLASAGALCCSSVAATTGTRADAVQRGGGQWTTYGGNFARTSNQPLSPLLRPLRRFWTSPRLDGAIYGEPLIDRGRVFVATESDRLYSLSARSGKILWQRDIGAPVPAGMLPCGDISPTVGVTSTMVINPKSGVLFVSGAVLRAGHVHHIVEAYSTTSGALIWRRDVDRLHWSATAQLQRAALGLADGRVVVGFGGNYGDCGNYHGFVLGVPESGSGQILSYEVPTPREAAVWAPSGISVNQRGDVFFATGNGASTTTYDQGDSVIELSPSWRQIGSFAPQGWRSYNANDEDLGSTAPLLISKDRLFIVGKEQLAFVLSSTRLGGVGGSLFSTRACFAIGGSSRDGKYLYLPCVGEPQLALRIQGDRLVHAWSSRFVEGASTTVAGGLVFSLGNPNELVGLSPVTGAIEVSLPTVSAERYQAPSAGEGLLVVAGISQVVGYVGPSGFLGPGAA